MLSKLGLQFDEASQIRLLEQTLAALRHQIALGSLVFADWAAFVVIFDQPYRQTLLEALVELVKHEIGSSTALSILGQIMSLLDKGKKLELAAIALAQGPRNHDQVPCLKMLGEAINILPAGERKNRQSRLAQRIVDFLDNVTSLDEKSRLALAPDLLPFMPTESASATAVAFFHAWKERNLKATSWLPRVVPFLPEPARTAEAQVIHDVILDSEDKLVNNHLLDEANVWLSRQEFEDLMTRLIAHAYAEPNARQRAMEIATLLKFAEKSEQHRLASYLLAQVELEKESDDLWVNVISRIVEVEEPDWIFDKVLPSVLELQEKDRSHCVRLPCEIANHMDASTARDLLAAANEILPPERWPRTSLLSVVSSFEEQSRWIVVAGILRELSKRGRVYQLRMIPQLFLVLAGLGDAGAVVQSWEALWDVARIWP